MRISERIGILKFGLAVAVLCGLSCVFAVAEEWLRVSLSPDRITEGQMARLSIHCDDGEKIRRVTFPEVDGVTWHENVRGSQTSIINGAVSTALTFGFTVSKTGEIAIPRIRVETSKGERFTQAVKFTVGKLATGLFREDGSEMPLSEAVFMRVQAQNPERKTYFVGEEIPVYVLVLSRPDVSVSLTSRPVLKTEDGALVANEKGSTQQLVTLGGKRYNAAIFLFELRAMKAGTRDIVFSGSANFLGDRRRSDPFEDSFFGDAFSIRGFGFSGRNAVPVPLSAELAGVSVVPRPAVPSGAIDLGIISAQNPEWAFSTETPKQGEPFYLDLKIRGDASGLISPEPKLKNFRTYPAEIISAAPGESEPNETTVRMMLIPLEHGEQRVALKFAVLNPKTGKYDLTEIAKTFRVAENQSLAAPVAGSLISLESDAKGNAVVAEKSHIRYIRSLSAETLERGKTLPNRGAFWIWVFPGVVALICVLAQRMRSRRQNNPAEICRRRARSRKADLLKKLASATPENFDALVRSDVTDYLADARGGVPVDELRRGLQTQNAALAEVLESAESAGYCPNAQCGNFEKFREIVVRAVKSGAFAFAAFAGACWIFPADVSAAENGEPEAIIRSAENAYAVGDFATAKNAFSQLAEIAPYSADVWFDLGNVFYLQKKFAPALVCYERAWRLDVGRGDILSNLNAARVRLGLPLRSEVKSPSDGFVVLRDSFSQFAWSAWAAGTLAFGCVLFVVWRRRRVAVAVLTVCVSAFGVFNWIWQYRELENPEIAFVVAENTEVYALPIKEKSAVRELASLPAGTQVAVLDSRGEWFLIRFNETEGWTEKSAVARVWGDWSVPDEK